MKLLRNRAKAHFPMLLATLLSIVQALALELLWSHIAGTGLTLAWTLESVTTLIQVITTFLAIVLIWVVFASAMMRFQWVPDTMESVYPFILGLVEFMLIKSLAAESPGSWLMLVAALFALMVWISHTIMRKARADGDNDEFFVLFERAQFRDFVPSIVMVTVLGSLGFYVWQSGETGVVAIISVIAATGILIFKFRETVYFWDQSLNDGFRQRISDEESSD